MERPVLSLGDRFPIGTMEAAMAQCAVCGNDYDKTFDVVVDGQRHTFDSFECAIKRLAPECAHCACKIIGHGVEADGISYCCAHCARHAGESRLRDRAEPIASGA
jgi:hypothetical protein